MQVYEDFETQCFVFKWLGYELRVTKYLLVDLHIPFWAVNSTPRDVLNFLLSKAHKEKLKPYEFLLSPGVKKAYNHAYHKQYGVGFQCLDNRTHLIPTRP